MSITFRRHYWLIIALIVLVCVCWAFGSTRIISYNIGEGGDVEIAGRNYENDISLYDDAVVHEISIGLSEEDYDEMVRTYQETGEKEYFRVSITIDGVTIPDVGVRLKGNLTLRQSLGGGGSEGMPGGNPNGEAPAGGNMRMPGGVELPDNWEEMTEEERMAFMQENGMGFGRNARQMGGDAVPFANGGMRVPPGMELPDNWEEMTEEERTAFMQENGPVGGFMGPGGGMMGGEGNGNNPPLLIKIDKFIPGQTYQGYAEIAVRLGSDASLLGEPVAYAIHDAVGQIVPETAYAVVQTAELEPSLYVLCEHLDERYTEEHFPGTDGILYKAGNFVGFEYKGDDPTEYAESFEQVTNVNDDDMAPLIRLLKFVSESSDEEFERDLPKWIDMDSFIRMMALDNLLSNNDSFVGMGSNYYLYYDKGTEQFTMLSWDQNLAMGGMGAMGGRNGMDANAGDEQNEERQRIFEEWLEEGGFGQEGEEAGEGQNVDQQRGFPGGRGSRSNLLMERFFANETFSQMYEAEYARLNDLIFNQDWALENVNDLAAVFTAYNAEHAVLEQETYDSGLERIVSYMTTRKESGPAEE